MENRYPEGSRSLDDAHSDGPAGPPFWEVPASCL